MRSLFKTACALLGSAAMLAACARNLDSATYTSDNTVGKVTYGTIISARPVTIKDHDKLEQNGLGGLAGGAAGGIAASGVGKGKGSAVAAVGGAIAGAVLGAYAQDSLSTQTGFEYIVQLDSPSYTEKAAQKKISVKGDNSVKQDIQDSMHTASTQSSAISIVQTDPQMLPIGQRVVVVYSDDRPRVVALH